MAKKPKSKLRQEYDRQIKRLKGAISRYNKRGILFSEKTMDIVNKNPKRVTHKTIERLKDISPKQLLKDAEFVDVETGEIESAVEHLKVEKEARKQQRKENYPTFSYIEKIIQEIKDSIPDYGIFYAQGRKPKHEDFRHKKNALISIIDDSIAQAGEKELENYYKSISEEISLNIHTINYDSLSENVKQSFRRLAELLSYTGVDMDELQNLEAMYES